MNPGPIGLHKQGFSQLEKNEVVLCLNLPTLPFLPCFITFFGAPIPTLVIFMKCLPLVLVTSYKYLGVVITSNLSWKPHIDSICCKTRRQLGMLYRKFYEHSNSSTLLKLYLTPIRPRLEYASPVWNPHHHNEINQIEECKSLQLEGA